MPSRGTAPRARLASGPRVSPLCRAPSHPPRSQRGAATGTRPGALPGDTSKCVVHGWGSTDLTKAAVRPPKFRTGIVSI